MGNQTNRTIKLKLLLFIILSISINSCTQASDYKKENENKTTSQTEFLKQNKEDLLTGITKGVCYSGFRSGQHPDRGNGAVNPTNEEILDDLKILTQKSNFELIRLYDSQENSESVLKLIRANNIKMKVMLGIWLDAEISNHKGCPWLNEPIPEDVLKKNKVKNKLEIERCIRLANEYKEIVVAVNVGNEALVFWNDHMVEVDTVISYVKNVKNSISQQVTVAENYDWWAKSGVKLAKEVDFVAVHSYPLWEGKDIDEGLAYTIKNLQSVRDALPNSRIVISELGWASIATEFGEHASEEKQLQYYKVIYKWATKMNITTFWFEAFDEDWKGNPDNPIGAEKHWGLYTVDRKPKKVMQK